MNNLEATTRHLYHTAMHTLDQQPEWINPDMGADFIDNAITISQGTHTYKITFETDHGLLIAHISHNGHPTDSKPIATQKDATDLFENIYSQLD